LTDRVEHRDRITLWRHTRGLELSSRTVSRQEAESEPPRTDPRRVHGDSSRPWGRRFEFSEGRRFLIRAELDAAFFPVSK
jgi:hypothetical protein